MKLLYKGRAVFPIIKTIDDLAMETGLSVGQVTAGIESRKAVHSATIAGQNVASVDFSPMDTLMDGIMTVYPTVAEARWWIDQKLRLAIFGY